MSGLVVPNSLRDITPRWLTKALNLSWDSGAPSVTGYSAETIADGKGFMNRLFRLRLDYDSCSPDLPPSIIAKLPSADPLLRSVFDRLGQNRREVRFYQELANSAHLPVPRSYHGGIDRATGDTVLLLEDLGHARQGDSVAGCSMEEARRCIAQLARFQASWWDSPLLDRLYWIPSKDTEAVAYQDIYPGAWRALQEKAGNRMPSDLRTVGHRLASEVHRIKAKLTRPPRTILHGDYRLDNCFFLTDVDSQSVIVFDWEFCGRGRGTYDVATFISEAFPPQQRREEELELLREYHSTLTENGVGGYSFEDCLYDYRLSMLDILVFWIVTGGYCNYEGERATLYLRNTLERIDAAVSDLASTETVGLM